jgi:ABC-type polysaccharide/polyol phosphate export permease
VLRYNPISLLLESYRQVIYGDLTAVPTSGGGTQLAWTTAMPPDLATLAVILVTGLAFLAIGTLIFKRLEPAFAKVL